MSRFRLALLYTAFIIIATILVEWWPAHPLAKLFGYVIGLAAVSLLFSTITWYRGDEVPAAAIQLSLTTSLGIVVGVEVALVLFTRDAGASALVGVGALFGLPVRILVSILVFAVFVSVGRSIVKPKTPKNISDMEGN